MKVLHNQSLLDFTLQHCGTLDALFQTAITNSISITSEIVSGSELLIPVDALVDNDILQFYSIKGIKPAFGNTVNELLIPELGIGQMAIGTTFIVR